jgi:hypothetical protein
MTRMWKAQDSTEYSCGVTKNRRESFETWISSNQTRHLLARGVSTKLAKESTQNWQEQEVCCKIISSCKPNMVPNGIQGRAPQIHNHKSQTP